MQQAVPCTITLFSSSISCELASNNNVKGFYATQIKFMEINQIFPPGLIAISEAVLEGMGTRIHCTMLQHILRNSKLLIK